MNRMNDAQRAPKPSDVPGRPSHRPRIGIIVQARMGSTRLPGKVLMDLNGTPALQVEMDQLRQCRLADALVLATSDAPDDRTLVQFSEDQDIPVFAGSVDDVLDRYYAAAKANALDVIVRVTGDCPLHDPAVVDQVIAAFLESRNRTDYVSNVDPPTYPDGLDTEVFTFAALDAAWKNAKSPSEREHVTPYVRAHAKAAGRALNVVNGTDLSSHRWTLDRREDLEFIRAVHRHLPRPFGMADVLAVLKAHPQYQRTNAHIRRNENFEGDPVV